MLSIVTVWKTIKSFSGVRKLLITERYFVFIKFYIFTPSMKVNFFDLYRFIAWLENLIILRPTSYTFFQRDKEMKLQLEASLILALRIYLSMYQVLF